MVEPMITLGKKPTLANRRLAFNRLRDRGIVAKLFGELGPRYAKRNGGYLRILKSGFRKGDNAPMALVTPAGPRRAVGAEPKAEAPKKRHGEEERREESRQSRLDERQAGGEGRDRHRGRLQRPRARQRKSHRNPVRPRGREGALRRRGRGASGRKPPPRSSRKAAPRRPSRRRLQGGATARRWSTPRCERYGRLDILDNNVGISVRADVLEVTEEQWDRVMAVNVKSIVLTAKYAIPHMIRGGGGSIINISSIAGLRANQSTPYSTSKAAVIGITRSMAGDHGRQGIRVNCIVPGLIYGPMVAGRMDAALRETRRQAVAARHRGHRLGHRLGGGLPRERRGALDHRAWRCRSTPASWS